MQRSATLLPFRCMLHGLFCPDSAVVQIKIRPKPYNWWTQKISRCLNFLEQTSLLLTQLVTIANIFSILLSLPGKYLHIQQLIAHRSKKVEKKIYGVCDWKEGGTGRRKLILGSQLWLLVGGWVVGLAVGVGAVKVSVKGLSRQGAPLSALY